MPWFHGSPDRVFIATAFTTHYRTANSYASECEDVAAQLTLAEQITMEEPVFSAAFLLFASQASFDIPARRVDAAGGLLQDCMLKMALEVAELTGASAEASLNGARSRCWTLRKDYREAFGPVVEVALRNKGIKHYGQDVVDSVADQAFEAGLIQMDKNVLTALADR